MFEISFDIILGVRFIQVKNKYENVKNMLLMSARKVSCVVDHLNGSKICRPSLIISTSQQFSVKIGKINHCLQFALTILGKKKTSLFTAIDIFTSWDEIFPTLPTALRNKF